MNPRSIPDPSQNDPVLARGRARRRIGSGEEKNLVSQSSAGLRAPTHARPVDPDLLERARRGATSRTDLLQLDVRHEAEAPAPPTQTKPWTDGQMRILINHRLREAIAAGYPPRNERAWRRAAEIAELENEEAHPGWIARASAGIQRHRHVPSHPK